MNETNEINEKNQSDEIKQEIEAFKTNEIDPNDETYKLNEIDVSRNLDKIICEAYNQAEGNKNNIKKIHLPKEMTIGIEIEAEGFKAGELRDHGELIKGYKTKKEISLSELFGIEITSPIIRSGEGREFEITQICNILKNMDFSVNQGCAAHIHIGANYLKNIDAWKNLCEIWSNAENDLYIISNQKGEAPRKAIWMYAYPLSPKIQDELNYGDFDMQNEENIEWFCYDLVGIQGNKHSLRFSGLNFNSCVDEKRDSTIEFRTPNGTINPNTWIENINLFGGIIKSSQDLADIQSKIEKNINLSPKEQLKMNAFVKLRELENTEKYDDEKLKSLLLLAVNPNDWNIYIDRYKTNKQLLQGRLFNEREPIKLQNKKIGNHQSYEEVKKIKNEKEGDKDYDR